LSKWAAKAGISFQSLDDLTRAARAQNAPATDEDVDLYIIENVDAKTLPKRILLSTWDYGTGHCMTLHVLKRNGSQFKKIWQSGENLCTESILGAARSQAMPDGRIIVRFRMHSEHFDSEKEKEPVIFRVKITYKWDGSAYVANRAERPEPHAGGAGGTKF